MPARLESGRAYTPPIKKKQTKKKPYVLKTSAPRGDAPQTRQRDMERADKFKDTAAYRGAVRAAQRGGSRRDENAAARRWGRASQTMSALQNRTDSAGQRQYRQAVRQATQAASDYEGAATYKPSWMRAGRTERAENRRAGKPTTQGDKFTVTPATREDKALLQVTDPMKRRQKSLDEGAARFTGMSDRDRARVERFTSGVESHQYQSDVKAARRAGGRSKPKSMGSALAAGLPSASNLRQRAKNQATPDPSLSLFGPTIVAMEEDPLGTTWNTAKSLPAIAKGAVGGIAEAVQHPIRTAQETPSRAKEDYVRRYGGDFDEQVARIKEEGAAAELTDATLIFGGAAAGVGRALGAAAKTGALGKGAKATMTTPRPLLRVREGLAGTVEQDASPNLFTRSMQHSRDWRRRAVEDKRVAKGRSTLQRESDDEVVRRFRPLQGAGMKVGVAARLGRGHAEQQSVQNTEIRAGLLKERDDAKKGLNKGEQDLFERLVSPALQDFINWGDKNARYADLDEWAEQAAKGRKKGHKSRGAEEDVVKAVEEIHAARSRSNVDEEKVIAALRDYATRQGQRAERLEGYSQVRGATSAQARRYAPRARVADPEYRADLEAHEKAVAETADLPRKEQEAALAELRASRRDIDARMVARAKERIGEGPAPAYVMHRPWKKNGLVEFAAGGTRAMAGDKRNKYSLLERGEMDLSHSAYEHGMARSLKREVQWNTHTDLLEGNAALVGPEGRQARSFSSRYAASAALHDDSGKREDDYRVIDMSLMRERAADDIETSGEHDADDSQGDPSIEKALREATLEPEPIDPNRPRPTYTVTGEEARFRPARRFVVVHKSVADELRAQATPSGKWGRRWGRVHSASSRMILATNPLYVPQNFISNLGATTVSAAQHGPRSLLNVALATGNREYAKLPAGSKRIVDGWAGLHHSAYAASGKAERAGASEHGSVIGQAMVAGYRAFADSGIAEQAKKSHWNPLTLNRRGDEIQNNVFRREVFYDQMRKHARDKIVVAQNGQMREIGRLEDVLRMPDDHPDKLAALRAAEPTLEKIARHTNDVLGNWTTFTAAERKYLRRIPLFYGFLRYATKLTFYTMPVKHPLLTAAIAKLGELHNEEIVELLGDEFFAEYGEQAKPYTREQIELAIRKEMLGQVASKVFYQGGDGRLKSIDVNKVNPFVGPLMDLFEREDAGLINLLSPIVQDTLNYMLFSAENVVTHAPLNLGGVLTPYGEKPKRNPLSFAAYSLRQNVRRVPALRALDEAMTPKGTKPSDDSLPFLNNLPVKPVDAKEQWVVDRSQRARLKSPGLRALDTTAFSPYERDNAPLLDRLEGAAFRQETKKAKDRKTALHRAGKDSIPGLTNKLTGQVTNTPEYTALNKRITALEKAHEAISKKPPGRKAVDLPPTIREKVDQALDNIRDSDPVAEINKKIEAERLRIRRQQAAEALRP